MTDTTFLGVPVVESWSVDSVESIESIVDRRGRRYTSVDEDGQRWLLSLPTLPEWMAERKGQNDSAHALIGHRFRMRQDSFVALFPQMPGVDAPTGQVRLAAATAVKDHTIRVARTEAQEIYTGRFLRLAGDDKVYMACSTHTGAAGAVDVEVYPRVRSVAASGTAVNFSPSGTFKWLPQAIRQIRHDRGSLMGVTVQCEEALS